MTFNVTEIVKSVCNGIMNKVNADLERFVDTDFEDLGTQDEIVRGELDKVDHLEVFDYMVEAVLDHPETQLCFESAKIEVNNWKYEMEQEAKAYQEIKNDYYRGVL